MIMATKYAGLLMVVILASAVYVSLGSEVRIRVDNDKSVLYFYEGGWKIAATDYSKLYNGTKIVTRILSGITLTTEINDTQVRIERTTPYKGGASITETFFFDGNLSNKGNVPVGRKIRISGGEGLIYDYEAKGLAYTGPTMDVPGNEFKTGLIKIKWSPQGYLQRVYSTGIFRLRYKVDSNLEEYDILMTDPTGTTTVLNLNGTSADRYYEYGKNASLSATIDCSPCLVCINISDMDGYTNVNCSNNSVTYDFETFSREWRFNDSTKSKTFDANMTLYVKLPSRIDMDSARINVSGSATMPQGVDVQVNGTNMARLVGTINGTRGDVFNLSDNTGNVTFILAGSSVKYLTLSKNTTITGATMNLTGIQSNVTSSTFNDSSTEKNITCQSPGLAGCNDTIGIIIPKDTTIYIANVSVTGSGVEFNYTDVSNGSVKGSGASVYYSSGSSYQEMAQSFLGNSSYNIIGVWLGTSTSYSPPCDLQVTLRESSPTGTVRATGYARKPPNAYTKVIFDSPYQTDSATTYFAVLVDANNTCNSTNKWSWAGAWDGSSYEVYANGAEWTRNPGVGNVWTQITNPTTQDAWMKTITNLYPTNISLDTASDGVIDWNFTGILNDTNSPVQANINFTSLQNYIDSNCISTNCQIPILVKSVLPGKIILNNVSIRYSSTPENVTLDVGNDGYNDWSQTGTFSTSSLADLNTTAIQNYVNGANCVGLTCNVPLTFRSSKAGTINITNVRANYTFNPISLNVSLLQPELNMSFNHTNVSIAVKMAVPGNVTVSGLQFDYRGPQKYNVTAYYGGNATYNPSLDSQWLWVVRSNFSRATSYTFTEDIIFTPKTNSSKNVTPAYQTPTIPIFNITSYLFSDYDGNRRNFTAAIKINETFACMNLTASNSSSKAGGFIVTNTSYARIYKNISYGQNFGIFLWRDYEQCNGTAYRKFKSNISVQTCCDVCNPCF